MPPMPLEIGAFVLLVAAQFPDLGALPTEPLTAVVTGTTGTVTAEGPDHSVLELRRGQVLPSGWEIRAPAGGAVRLVCSNDRRLIVAGPGRLLLDRPACDQGERMAPETYRALAPAARTLVPASAAVIDHAVATRTRVLRIRTRGWEEDDPRVPVLLDPRRTAVLSARPELRWTRVTGAREYVLELIGPAPWSATLPADRVDCHPLPSPPGTLDACLAPWPESAPDLPPGSTSFLSISALRGVARVSYTGELHRIWRPEETETEELLRSLSAIREAGATAEERSFETALFLIEHELLGEAAADLRQQLATAPSAQGFLLQGSLLLELGLPRGAYRSFREAACRAEELDLATEALRGAEVANRLVSEP